MLFLQKDKKYLEFGICLLREECKECKEGTVLKCKYLRISDLILCAYDLTRARFQFKEAIGIIKLKLKSKVPSFEVSKNLLVPLLFKTFSSIYL